MGTKLTELAIRIHALNKEKGFYDNPPSDLERHMLIVSEIAEATECVRKNDQDFYFSPEGKPEGHAVEVIDALIRILDFCGSKKWDVDELMREKLAYNKTRPYKHGKTI